MKKEAVDFSVKFSQSVKVNFLRKKVIRKGMLCGKMKECISSMLGEVADLESRKVERCLGVDGDSPKGKKDEDIDRQVSCLISYPSFVDYFRFLSDGNRDRKRLVAGVFMVYGWMPRIPRFNCGEEMNEEEFIEVYDFLSRLQKCGLSEALDLMDEDGVRCLEKVKRMTNNSVVGMSKLLHFVNPVVFPMYDSHIQAIVGEVESVGDYLGYMKGFNGFCGKFIDEISEFAKSREIFNLRERFSYDKNFILSHVRLVEMSLFLVG